MKLRRRGISQKFLSLENSCVQVLQLQFDQPVPPNNRVTESCPALLVVLLTCSRDQELCRGSSRTSVVALPQTFPVQRLPVGRQGAQTSAAQVASLARQSLVNTLSVRADVGDRRKDKKMTSRATKRQTFVTRQPNKSSARASTTAEEAAASPPHASPFSRGSWRRSAPSGGPGDAFRSPEPHTWKAHRGSTNCTRRRRVTAFQKQPTAHRYGRAPSIQQIATPPRHKKSTRARAPPVPSSTHTTHTPHLSVRTTTLTQHHAGTGAWALPVW